MNMFYDYFINKFSNIQDDSHVLSSKGRWFARGRSLTNSRTWLVKLKNCILRYKYVLRCIGGGKLLNIALFAVIVFISFVEGHAFARVYWVIG